MRIAVLGAGAVGSYFGGRLAQAGEDVTFIARGATLDALRADGLSIESPRGDAVLREVRVFGTAEEVGTVDVVVLGVKAWQVPAAAEAIRPLVGERTLVLPLQNGVEAADQLAAVHPRSQVLGAMCRIMAEKTTPARVRHVGVEPFIFLGELGGRPDARTDELIARLHDAGVGAQRPSDIRVTIWRKFLFIAPVSGMGAVTRVPIGVLRSTAETRAMLIEGMWEIVSVGRALGLDLQDEDVEDTIEFLDHVPAEGTASMQRDIVQGRPSELEALSGAVVRLGRQTETPTPVHRFLYGSLLPGERLARERDRAPSR